MPKKIVYGLAEYDRHSGFLDYNINLPMDGVNSGGGNLYEFLRSAGENGWDLCAAFPVSRKGSRRAMPAGFPDRVSEDAAEEIAMIFKKLT